MGKYIQINDANWRIPYVGGWCEGYVEGAWGKATLPTTDNQTTSGIYGSAIQAWDAVPEEHRHYDLPPLGITVPVYFSLGNVWQGHVAIRLDDGMVASSTQGGYHSQGYIHPNIQHMIDVYGKYNGGCTVLGWVDTQWGVEIVRYQPDITTIEETEKEVIPFESITQEDEHLPVGSTKISVQGENGELTTVETVYLSDGVETSREIKSSEITKKPIMQVVNIGTYEKPTISEDDKKFIVWLKTIFEQISKFFTGWKG